MREGFRSIEHVKRYTTNGMATDQGKLSNINGLMIAADAVGRAPPEVGLTTFRPPYTPTTFGAFAGYHRGAQFEAVRKTPIDAWAEAQERGLRARGPVAPRPLLSARRRGHARSAVARECRATRASLGLFDASTLGKIEVAGPDAVEFMNRMYTNPWTKLAPGRCRYGLLLGDDGFIRDDGVIGRLAGRPLPRHHHHRGCGARAQRDGGLPPDRMARPQGLAHLHHRAVGHGRAQRPQRPPRAGRRSWKGSTSRPDVLPPHVDRALHASRGSPPGSSASASRASSASRSTSPRATG